MPLDTGAVQCWFDSYLDTFAASSRGERPMSDLLDCYAVPLTLTTDEGALSLFSRDSWRRSFRASKTSCGPSAITTPTWRARR